MPQCLKNPDHLPPRISSTGLTTQTPTTTTTSQPMPSLFTPAFDSPTTKTMGAVTVLDWRALVHGPLWIGGGGLPKDFSRVWCFDDVIEGVDALLPLLVLAFLFWALPIRREEFGSASGNEERKIRGI
ncbi:hypothetical protein U1Q18_008704 [Sarracenia purpurea var. burkii]